MCDTQTSYSGGGSDACALDQVSVLVTVATLRSGRSVRVISVPDNSRLSVCQHLLHLTALLHLTSVLLHLMNRTS